MDSFDTDRIKAGASYQDNGFWFQTFCFAKKAVFVDKAFYMNRRDNPNSSVYNPGKVYCVCEEYAYIADNGWLIRLPKTFIADVYRSSWWRTGETEKERLL